MLKIKDHILKEHRNVPIYKDKKRFVLRILPREHPIAHIRGCRKAFYMEVWNTFFIGASKRYGVTNEVKDLRGEFDTIEGALQFIKQKGYRITHPRKLSKLAQRLIA